MTTQDRSAERDELRRALEKNWPTGAWSWSDVAKFVVDLGYHRSPAPSAEVRELGELIESADADYKESHAEDPNSYGAGYDWGRLEALREVRALLSTGLIQEAQQAAPLSEREARSVAALKPFAAWAEDQLGNAIPANILADNGTPVLDRHFDDESALGGVVTVGDLRRAVEALAAYHTEKEEG